MGLVEVPLMVIVMDSHSKLKKALWVLEFGLKGETCFVAFFLFFFSIFMIVQTSICFLFSFFFLIFLTSFFVSYA